MRPHLHIPFHRIKEHLPFILEKKLDIELFLNTETLDSIVLSDISRLAKDLKHNPNISVHGPFMDLSPGAMDHKIRSITIERYLKTIEMTAPLKPRAIVFHSGYEKWKYGLKNDVWLKESITTWKFVLEASSKIGSKIAIENIFEESPDNLRLLMNELSSERFGICFDTGHFNLFSKTPLKEWLDELLPYVMEFHLHDNLRDFDSHLPIGDGSFDFDLLFSIIGKKDYLFTLEAHSAEDAMKSLGRFNSLCQRYRS